MRTRADAKLLEVHRLFRFLAAALVVVVLLCLLSAMLVPFTVPQEAPYSEIEGEIYQADALGNERESPEEIASRLRPGQSIRLEEGSRLEVELIAGSGLFALLIGPGEWRLVEAESRGTLLEHVTGNVDNYTLLLEQQSGTAVFDLGQGNIERETLEMVLQLPDGNLRPSFTCFQVSVDTEAETSAVVEVPCGGDIRPLSEPRLPTVP
ncbi:MAG: hypothetical protein HC915_01775 [Anaerolineae bacterium]|nr:hypothetical protein [Anaerolineae bacterium]